MVRHSKALANGAFLVWAQGATSLSNLLLTVLVARSSSVTAFAAFALTFPLYLIGQRLTRVYLLVPRQIETASTGHAREQVSKVVAACFLSGLLFCSVGLAAFFALGADNRWLLLFSLAMPALMIYEQVRYEYISKEDYRRVSVLDSLWLVSQLAGSATVSAVHADILWHGVAWLLFPTVCSLVVLGRHLGNLSGGFRHVTGNRHLAHDAVTDVVASVLVIQAVPYLVIVFSSLDAAAGLRGAQTLLGPINVAIMGVLPILQGGAARANADSVTAVSGVFRRHVALAALLTVSYAMGLTLMPDSVGVMLLGDTWSVTGVILAGLSLHLVLRTPALLCVTTLRSLGALRAVVTTRLAVSVLLLLGAVVGSLLSVAAIGWGMATAGLLGSCFAYRQLQVTLRQAGRAPAMVPPGQPAPTASRGAS